MVIVLALSAPPESTVSVPPLLTWLPIAEPPDEDDLDAAAHDRGAAVAAAREDDRAASGFDQVTVSRTTVQELLARADDRAARRAVGHDLSAAAADRAGAVGAAREDILDAAAQDAGAHRRAAENRKRAGAAQKRGARDAAGENDLRTRSEYRGVFRHAPLRWSGHRRSLPCCPVARPPADTN